MKSFLVFSFWNEYEQIDGGASDFNAAFATLEEAKTYAETLNANYLQIAHFDGESLKILWTAEGWEWDKCSKKKLPDFKWRWEEAK
jgi:hypothetical protein